MPRTSAAMPWSRPAASIVVALLIFGASPLDGSLSPPTVSAQVSPAPLARAVSVQGTVEVRRAGTTAWQAARLDEAFAAGDTIRVGERSRADLAMLDQSVLRLNANTEVTLEPVKEVRTGVVNMIRGAAHFFSRGPRSLEVQTPFTIAGVRGTEFLVDVEPDRTFLTIFEGTVLAENPAGRLTLVGGQSAVAESGQPPVVRVVARPRDAVHWALHYPPVLYWRADEFPAGPGWQGMVRESLEHYRRGDLPRAFDSIAAAPPTVSDPRFFAYRAHLLLAVGRVDEAGADIERALKLSPDDANALALATIIAVVQGDRTKASAGAQRAVQVAPGSATARIALSYAQQAAFDLEGARGSAQKAVELDPQNALAWARLSELWASFGELDEARDAAHKAAILEPNLSRTQTVLGYAHLMRIDTRAAREAFEKAIALDSADPLPRLGLGLARIRDGDLHGGSRDVEAAASLDPSNAIVRSYLGKAYYEEKRPGLDEREYAVAKQLDPQDPTPYFYDAIAKQTTNRPVEALREMQRAIELNDNRAVYRSRLLLDADEAARTAAQARIYSDLGFQQLALVEGWKSVNTDPTNSSAHRFLADSYAALPRHEIARVSELLQSQLLQPLSMTPIQPRLAESNLFLISAGGPGSLAFNEFNPLFNRNGVSLLTTGMVGENATWAGEAVLAGIYKNLAVSVGYTHFETNGFRPNSGQNDDIANAFVQFEISPRTSIQAEYRYRETERGDLRLRFFPDDVFPDERNTEERHTYRLGARHAFSPGSIALGSFIYSTADSSTVERQLAAPVNSLELTSSQESFSGELQHLFRSRYVNLTTGGGYAKVDGPIDGIIRLDLPPPLDIAELEREFTDVRHWNMYAYAHLNLLEDVTFILGASADLVSGKAEDFKDTEHVNPKVGVIWNPFPATTIRAAAFRTLKRTLITNQTLEPTQVAGFNQFFDDFDATDAWRYGAAVDQKFSRDVFGGVELSQRDMRVPFFNIDDPANPILRQEDWRERVARGYAFWTPHPWVALRLEYAYERFTTEGLTDQPRELQTHRVPVGMNVFHPTGVGGSVRATYVNQSGRFVLNDTSIRSGQDDFVIVDAALSYRLPRRFGLITAGVTNLFDKEFRFFDRDIRNPTIMPDRMVFGRVTLAFP
jgi:tetratricopeptide (TPR) repeat protein